MSGTSPAGRGAFLVAMITIVFVIVAVAGGFSIANWALTKRVDHIEERILKLTHEVKKELELLIYTVGNDSNVTLTTINSDVESFFELLLATTVGEYEPTCDDGNMCTVDVGRIDWPGATANDYCVHYSVPYGTSCNDSCLIGGLGVCDGENTCIGECPGYCSFNMFTESIYYLKKRGEALGRSEQEIAQDIANAKRIAGPTYCDDSYIEVQDFFTNNTVFNDSAPVSNSASGFGQLQNWLMFNTSNPYHKFSICLEHQCMYVVPVWPPQAFIHGFEFPLPQVFIYDTPGDTAMYDKMCQSLLNPEVTSSQCLTGRISTSPTMVPEFEYDYACIYTFNCAFDYLDNYPWPGFVGRRGAAAAANKGK